MLRLTHPQHPPRSHVCTCACTCTCCACNMYMCCACTCKLYGHTKHASFQHGDIIPVISLAPASRFLRIRNSKKILIQSVFFSIRRFIPVSNEVCILEISSMQLDYCGNWTHPHPPKHPKTARRRLAPTRTVQTLASSPSPPLVAEHAAQLGLSPAHHPGGRRHVSLALHRLASQPEHHANR